MEAYASCFEPNLANRIRGYVAHIRTSASNHAYADSALFEWMEWALTVATTLDPTERRLAPPTPESNETSQE